MSISESKTGQAELPPEIEEINDRISAANDAIRSARSDIDDANLEIERANDLIGDWNADHRDQQLDDIEEIDTEDLPDERNEIRRADLDPPNEAGEEGDEDGESRDEL
jgi:hypothetical protein